ncbi:MAG: tetratricopeptide repeat protein [Phycisphaerales bacterium]|nr:MAG: tetratricopeptide repeat protein [Phycisphaerales bacterium]
MTETMKSCCRTCVLLFLAVSLIAPPGTFASDAEAPGPEQAEPKTARELLQTRITYECANKPIDDVLMDLAEQTGIDIIKSPKVTGNVTAKIPDVPLAEALTNILEVHGNTYIATDHMIRVVPISQAKLAPGQLIERLVSRIYRITYADANDVAQALTDFVSDRGKVALNRTTCHVVVTDTEDRIKAIDRFIEQLDRETPQVEIEVRIYDITTKEGFELGTEWYAARNAPLKTTEYTENKFDSDTPDTLTTTTLTKEMRTEFDHVYEKTEGRYPNSDSAVRSPGYMEVTENSTNARKIGIGGPPAETTTVEEIPKTTYESTKTETYTTRRRKPFAAGSFDRLQGGSLSFSLLNDAVDLEFALSVLQTQVEARLLANPRILVLDNQTANFEIVRQVPYRELEEVPLQDPVTYTDFKNIGVLLEVTPHIARQGMLRVHLRPEFGVLVGQDRAGRPTIDVRRADTVALLKDGQTIAIGGLRREQKSKDIAKVPVFADIPLLGGMFRSETESEEINELLVLITPKVISSPELLKAEPIEGFEESKIAEKTQQPRVEAEPVVAPREDAPDAAVEQPDLMLSAAFAHLKAGRYEPAKEKLTSLIEIQPDNSKAHQYLGYCHLKLQQLDQALESYSKAIELDDEDWEAHRGLGVACMLKAIAAKDDSLKQKALEQWQRSLEIKPDQPNRDGLVRLIDLYSE